MTTITSKKRRVVQAGYAPIVEDVPVSRSSCAVEHSEKEPKLAYSIEFACSESVFKQGVEPYLDIRLKSTLEESAIKQWSSRSVKHSTHYTCSVEQQQSKQLLVSAYPNSLIPFGLDNVQPHPKDDVTIEEAFIPIRPAIQVGEQLGLPTQGFVYHFLDGQMLSEYQFGGGRDYHFLRTESVPGAMNPTPDNSRATEFILALWKRGGEVVQDQYLFFSRKEMDDNAMALVDGAFLEEHGVKLDMAELVPLSEGNPSRKNHTVVEGDTLADIAETNSLTLEELTDFNPFWRNQDALLQAGDKLYLEPVSVYNHGVDVSYPTNTSMIFEKVLSLGEISTKPAFPVVKVAESEIAGFAAIAPVRYAVDAVIPESLLKPVLEGMHPIDDDSRFPGGIFKSEEVPYTLRQLRDGWLYTLHQDPDNDQWQLHEYQVQGGEFYRFKGDDAAVRREAKPEPVQSYVMTRTDCPYYVGYASQRWTQRVVDYYLHTEQARQDWLREINVGVHRTHIDEIETLVADIGDDKDLNVFNWSSAITDLDEDDEFSLMSRLISRNKKSYQYQVPSHAPHAMVVLDDPMADLNDLYLRLARSVLPTVLDEETLRKSVVAQAVRALVRISLPPESVKAIEPKDWVDVDQDIDTCLEYQYLLPRKDELHTPTGAHFRAKAKPIFDEYPKAMARLEARGIDPSMLEKRFDEYIERRKAHQQVKWPELDAFYKQHLETQANANIAVQRDLPILVSALKTLGNDPRHLGLDIGEHDHQYTLSTLMNCILHVFDLGASACSNDEEDEGEGESKGKNLNKRIEELLTNPDNLAGVASNYFSSKVYAKVEDLVASIDLGELGQNNAIPLGGFLAAFNDVVGFNDPNSALFTATKTLLVPVEEIVNNAKAAVAVKGDKAIDAMQLMRFKLVNRLANVPGLTARRNMAMSLWGQVQASGGKLSLEDEFPEREKGTSQKYHKLLKSAFEAQKALKAETKGSKEYQRKNDVLKNLNKKVAHFVGNTPKLFRGYQDSQMNKHVFSDKVNDLSKKWDVVGGMDIVVSTLSVINVLVQISALQKAVADAPYPDTRRIKMTVSYSAVWMVNIIGAQVRGMAFRKLPTTSRFLAHSLDDIKVKPGKEFTKSNTLHAEKFIARSILAGAAGVIAAGLEGWQIIEDYNASNDRLEKALIILKGGALVGQGSNWGFVAFQALRSRYLGLAIGRSMAGWAMSFNIWGAALYLVVTFLISLTQKTPLETWLLNCVWGKEPDPDLSAEEEFFKLYRLINQPSVQSQLLKRKMMPLSSFSATSTEVFIDQSITITLPNTYEYDKIAMTCFIDSRGREREVLSAQDWARGVWSKDSEESTTYYFKLTLPRTLRHIVTYHERSEPPQINLIVLKDLDSPYQDDPEQFSSTIYQSKLQAGFNQNKAMVILDAIPLNHKPIMLEVPKYEKTDSPAT
ncbi:toxin VasX [Vibrio ostreicida]|uniref:LysM peptidoglycan-binding domain-containing protein n=1 Tax=Vibrio ostreicida TaxID=526588 RepID=A0ABT8BXZ4_9VIBR|nr:LysM peptidoglycan-binding domain-containing protein [Vibrio ostreicida]MDN3611127.1 LysM peptidoglycan-binding domain-containing protein [Vibrio ostreicida]MDN3611264.1 LysM peptidoglycan-binding domain-containing protein [Vibrio ostreicida]MDN3612595.1 LysM peptidoglycan-binding domain-containing protein [Vibrio ostreicida]NPD09212.1 LysM peptidoglycan-binding domain-containing protein [Vibrio ostreicida]